MTTTDDTETTTIEPEPAIEPTEETADAPELDETEADEPGDDRLKKARREAANYRERLRTAEAGIADANERITNLRWQLVAPHLNGMKPDALRAAGVDLDTLLDGDTPNTTAIRAAAKEAREQFGLPSGMFQPIDVGLVEGGASHTTGWHSLLQ